MTEYHGPAQPGHPRPLLPLAHHGTPRGHGPHRPLQAGVRATGGKADSHRRHRRGTRLRRSFNRVLQSCAQLGIAGTKASHQHLRASPVERQRPQASGGSSSSLKAIRCARLLHPDEVRRNRKATGQDRNSCDIRPQPHRRAEEACAEGRKPVWRSPHADEDITFDDLVPR